MLAKAGIHYAKINEKTDSEGMPSAVGMTNRDLFSVKGVFA